MADISSEFKLMSGYEVAFCYLPVVQLTPTFCWHWLITVHINFNKYATGILIIIISVHMHG